MGYRQWRNSKQRKKLAPFFRFLIQVIMGLGIIVGGAAIATQSVGLMPFSPPSIPLSPAFDLPSDPFSTINPLPADDRLFSDDLLFAMDPSRGLSIREHVYQGQVDYEAEQYADAIAHWQTALDRLPSQVGSGQRLFLFTNLALAYQQLGQWGTAQKMVDHGFPHALTLLEQPYSATDASISTDGRSPSRLVGRFFNIQGILQWHQGETERALDSWQRSIDIYDQDDYLQGTLGSQLNQARALQALGFFSRAQAQVQTLTQIIESQPDSAFKALGLRNVGNVLWHIGNLKDAIAILTQSLEIEDQTDRDRLQTLIMLGHVERTAAEQADAIGHQDAATRHRNNALAWYEQAALCGHSVPLQANAQVNALNFLVHQSQWASATELAEAIASTIAQLEPTPTTLPIELNYARSLALIALSHRVPANLRSIEPHQAESVAPPSSATLFSLPNITQRFTKVIQQAQTFDDIHLESYARGQLGHFYEQTGHWSLAQSLTEQALALANQIQAPDIQYQWEWQKGRIFVGQMGLDQSHGTKLGAGAAPNTLLANVLQHSSSESLRDQAIASYGRAVKALEHVRRDLLVIDADIQFSFRDNVEPLYRQYVDVLLRSPQPTSTDLVTATELIDSLQLAELENSLRCDVQRFIQISQATVDNHTAIIYPILLDDRLEVMLALPNQPLKRHQMEVSRLTVENTIRRLQRQLPRTSRRKLSQSLSSDLYQWLIQPWEQFLNPDEDIESSEIDTLVFVLDGDLKSLPMAALWDQERQRYLLERYAIAVVPSLQLIDPQPLARPIRVLAAGSTNALDHPLTDKTFPPLEGVQDELNGISRQVSTETLLNEGFTRPKLIDKLNTATFDILHLATHGEFSADPNHTFVMLNDAPLYAPELDQLLRLNKDLRSSIEMIVLSACQTATGDKRATLGLAGLTLRAGSQSALATLWSVEDQSAAVLMQEFYRQMATHQDISRAEALRRSQLQLWQEDINYGKDWEAQAFWSPYVLVGNWL